MNYKTLEIITCVLDSLMKHPSDNKYECISDFANLAIRIIDNGKEETIKELDLEAEFLEEFENCIKYPSKN